MAKKIKLDFSKVEERSGWNTRQIPEGLHRMEVVSVQDQEAQDGTDMWVFGLVPTDSRYKSRKFPYYCKLQQNQLWKVRDLLIAAGLPVPKKSQQIDPNKVVGAIVAGEVEDDSYNGVIRSQLQGTYAASIIDEDESADEPEDDEEYEDEELEDSPEDEDFDDVEEDLEDDEDDFDDDDLEDEDLEDDEDFDDEDDDEEEEEEEEEPAPAPKRKAAARKPAAKAKAAPAAKRTVKRRR